MSLRSQTLIKKLRLQPETCHQFSQLDLHIVSNVLGLFTEKYTLSSVNLCKRIIEKLKIESLQSTPFKKEDSEKPIEFAFSFQKKRIHKLHSSSVDEEEKKRNQLKMRNV
jgi:hypothetical protein